MKRALSKLHAKVGDFWWYSLMIFVACRSGDAIQAFIGLWLVPKYVGPGELGAVLPLQQLAGLFSVPLAILATVFAKYVNVYATRGEYGKVKGFIRDVLGASAALFALCIAGAYLIMPFFYERLRIVSGSLTALILLCGLTANIGTIVASAQQGLKRFKAMSAMSLVSAPIRLVTLLVAMPIRALSGYLLGQATPTATTSILSVLDIRNALRGHAPDTSWRRDLPKIWRFLWPFAICTLVGTFAGTMTATVYRQRLPEVESAAYYMLTRFSDMVGFVATAVSLILFPLASEAHEQGKENRRLLVHSVLATLGGSVLLALAFGAVAKPVFSLTETWRPYAPFAHLLPILTVTAGIGLSSGAIANYELACRRIGATALLVTLNLLWAGVLVSFAGHNFFLGIFPASVLDFMRTAHFDRLVNLAWYTLDFQILQLLALGGLSLRASRR